MNAAAPVPVPKAGVELAGVVLLSWFALLAVPWLAGGIGLSWDALNHHIYLGWVAQHPRFDRDLFAASYQGYQYPYAYWPAYKLFELGVSGLVAGAILVSLHVIAVPALWLAARACVPERDWYAVGMRTVAVLLGLSSELFLSLLDTTANDALAAVPLVWAAALALVAATPTPAHARISAATIVSLSGTLAGLSVALKFSNGPIAVLLPVLWVACGETWRQRVLEVVRGGSCACVAFLLAYAPWGAQLWQHFGNPIFPFCDPCFAPARHWLGWQP